LAVLAHDEAAYPGLPRLDVLAIHADVPDLGIGHGDELPVVRWVRQDLLIARHAGVEDELADGLARGAEGLAVEDRAVGECQDCGTPAHAGVASSAAAERSGAAGARSSCTSRPPTSTATARPETSHPSNGVFRPLERKLRASTRQRRAGSTSVRSAAAPAASVPAGRRRTRAGPTVMRATIVGRSATPSATRRSASGRAV